MKTLASCLFAAALGLTLSTAHAGQKKKMTYENAKKECLKDEPELKGKPLQKCITKKRK